MSEHIVKILEANFIAHDVKRFLFEKPKGYTFIPGQATEVAINLPEWKSEFRPFTFTGLARAEHLEIMTKIYNSHNGVTNKLASINAGSELIIKEPFGTIQYKGPGVFIAGGAGITPFIAILRELHRSKRIAGNKLINSNKTSLDVIIGAELAEMLKENFINVYTRENIIGYLDRRITIDFLIENIGNFSQPFYVCGPDKFVKDISEMLLTLGAVSENLVVEK